ncbi:MAG: bifunctional adenosylcobinamide kinase/adenosylcobinamide-phosphate guanylyltransferase [Candidatus Omnitrophica bacterium]|nr:bifunctional adenosylcobinamide kinase/adenosylcobinamide-phosphate guanylyltransferase [Candidatus Omnitrophota bacterium]
MSKIILILGGARSGKSSYAVSLAKKFKKIAFVATCEGLDREMRKRIELHKKDRPKNWKTYEEPRNVSEAIKKIDNSFDCILIDCLTLLVSNLVLNKFNQEKIIKAIQEMLVDLKKKKATVIIVSNEVGLGIVPATKLGREFRDIAGRVNQVVAKEADKVFFTVSGIATCIK